MSLIGSSIYMQFLPRKLLIVSSLISIRVKNGVSIASHHYINSISFSLSLSLLLLLLHSDLNMGRPPCCDKANVKKGLWTPEEDAKILAYVSNHGVGNWTQVPKKAGNLRRVSFLSSSFSRKMVRYYGCLLCLTMFEENT